MIERTAYKVNLEDVPVAPDLRTDEGWFDLQVQFAINEERAGSTEAVFGRTVFRPGARHEWHRHENAAEIQYLQSGEGIVLDGDDEIPMAAGDVVYTPRGRWHGFRNPSSTADAVMIWIWVGGGSPEVCGYEVRQS